MWGLNGGGGSGAWNDTAVNWFDGAQNVPWTSGSDAVFQGTSGGVNAASENASSLTFNIAGYTVSGNLVIPTNGMTISTAANATISATFSDFQPNFPTVTKTGGATLTLTTPITAAAVSIAQGEVRLSAASSTPMTFALGNTASALLTLDTGVTGTFPLVLSGGGTTGGVVQPASTAGTATMVLSTPTTGTNSFDGVLQNNGSGTLAVQVSTQGVAQVFTNAETYTGSTVISAGTLTLSGNGSLLNSQITIGASGTLSANNSGTAVGDRISDNFQLLMQGGTFSLTGPNATLGETIGGITLTNGSSQLTLVQGGLPPTRPVTTLLINNVTRNNHATVNLTGAHIILNGITNDTSGITPVWITFGSEWGVSQNDGSLLAFSNYVTTQATSAATKNLKLTAGGTTSFTANTTANTLNLEGTTTAPVLDLGTHTLTLVSGGILSVSSVNATIQNGALTSTSSEYVITNSNTLTISANIGQNVSGTVLTKSGAGTLALSGTNTYSGVTSIQKGTLLVTADSNLGVGTSVEFGGGTLRAGANFSTTKNVTSVGGATAVVDTNGFNVSLSGSISGSLTKIGAGILSISSAPSGAGEVDAGTLSFTGATGGTFNLGGGMLTASGTITRLTTSAASILDPAGAAAGNLTIGTLAPAVPLTIDFGLGTTTSDHLTITSALSSGLALGVFQFEFQDLGGLTTGVDYSLASFGGTAPSASLFALAPDLIADGWQATFTSNSSGLSVNFRAIPEPSSVRLLAMAAGMLGLRRRRRVR